MPSQNVLRPVGLDPQSYSLLTRIQISAEQLRGRQKDGRFNRAQTVTLFDELARLAANPYPGILEKAKKQNKARRIRWHEIEKAMVWYLREIKYRRLIQPFIADGHLLVEQIDDARAVCKAINRSRFADFPQALLAVLSQAGLDRDWAAFHIFGWWDMTAMKYAGNCIVSTIKPRSMQVLKRDFCLLPFAGQLSLLLDEMPGDHYFDSLASTFLAELDAGGLGLCIKANTVLYTVTDLGCLLPRLARYSIGKLRKRRKVQDLVAALSMRFKMYLGYKSMENSFRHIVLQWVDLRNAYKHTQEAGFDIQLCRIAEWAFALTIRELERRLGKLDDHLGHLRPRYPRLPGKPRPSRRELIKLIPMSPNSHSYCLRTSKRFMIRTRYLLKIMSALCQLSRSHNDSFPQWDGDGSLYKKVEDVDCLQIFTNNIMEWAEARGVTIERLPKRVTSLPELKEWLKNKGLFARVMRPRRAPELEEAASSPFEPLPIDGLDEEEPQGWDLEHGVQSVRSELGSDMEDWMDTGASSSAATSDDEE